MSFDNKTGRSGTLPLSEHYGGGFIGLGQMYPIVDPELIERRPENQKFIGHAEVFIGGVEQTLDEIDLGNGGEQLVKWYGDDYDAKLAEDLHAVIDTNAAAVTRARVLSVCRAKVQSVEMVHTIHADLLQRVGFLRERSLLQISKEKDNFRVIPTVELPSYRSGELEPTGEMPHGGKFEKYIDAYIKDRTGFYMTLKSRVDYKRNAEGVDEPYIFAQYLRKPDQNFAARFFEGNSK